MAHASFWNDLPLAVRAQFVELLVCDTCEELGRRWCWQPPEAVREYIRGAFTRRLLQDGGKDAVDFLLGEMAERGI